MHPFRDILGPRMGRTWAGRKIMAFGGNLSHIHVLLFRPGQGRCQLSSPGMFSFRILRREGGLTHPSLWSSQQDLSDLRGICLCPPVAGTLRVLPMAMTSLSLLCRTSLVRPGTSAHQSSHNVQPRRRQLLHWLGHTRGQSGVATSLPWGAYSPEVLISLALGRPSLDNCWADR